MLPLCSYCVPECKSCGVVFEVRKHKNQTFCCRRHKEQFRKTKNKNSTLNKYKKYQGVCIICNEDNWFLLVLHYISPDLPVNLCANCHLLVHRFPTLLTVW